MAQDEYRYSLEFFREDWSAVDQMPAAIDWEPAIECTHFNGVRSGRLPQTLNVSPAAVLPVWDHQLREPYVESFEIVMRASNGANFVGEVTLDYLTDLARAQSVELVKDGKLRSGERFRYRVCAFARSHNSNGPAATGFTLEEEVQPLDLALSSLGDFISDCQAAGIGPLDQRDAPVFIPARVLDEVRAAANQAGDLETGGVLLGKLHRDQTVPEVFIEITAQVHALHTEAEHTKLTFTAEAWESVRAAIKLRRRNELMMGWWHTHPDFCKKCPPERRAVCVYSRPFFSADDCALHRAVFSRAFNVGLLASYLGNGELTHTLFGWRYGMIAARGFYVRAPMATYKQTHTEDNNNGATKC